MSGIKILALDSTAKVASAAILDGERVLAQYHIDNGLTQSELLLPMVESMMQMLHLDYKDIGLYAASVGPGSFTGVRIGAALIKGLAFGKDVPCAAVSTLEAIAENIAPLEGILVPVMDARRGQVYTAIFDSDGENLTRVTPDAALSLEELGKKLTGIGKGRTIYLAGDGYETAREALAALPLKLANTPPLLREENAASVGIVALRKYRAGEITDDRDLAPTYLRKPQAERERLEKEQAEKK